MAIHSSLSRERIAKPPMRMIPSASAIHHDIGPHQKSSGSARVRPSSRKQSTRPKLDGLKMCSPRHLTRCFESSETAAVPAKIHQPRRLHQSPCSVPGTRRMNATPFPVRRALAGHMITRCVRAAIPTSSTAHVTSEMRICAIESRNENATWPSTCSETIVAARCSRGSFSFGSRTGYGVPRIVSVRPPESLAAWAAAACALMRCRSYFGAASVTIAGMRLAHALAIVSFVVDEAAGPVSVFVADDHGEIVAAATMDGAAPDTRLNAQRKAYTAARSDARSTAELAEKVRDDPVERASFDPFFTFFRGGVTAFEGDERVGAVGVPGDVDEQLARRAIAAAGLSCRPRR